MTPKQEAFVQEYLIDLNATQAAIRAGYSKKTANEQASRLLANVKVAAAIAEAQAKRAEKSEIDALWVLKEAEEVYLLAKGGLGPENPNPALVNSIFKGLDTIGKHINVQAFKERLEIERTADNLTDEELDAEIAKRLAS